MWLCALRGFDTHNPRQYRRRMSRVRSEATYTLTIDPTVDPLDVCKTVGAQFGNRVSMQLREGETEFRTESAKRLRAYGPTKLLAMAGSLEEAVLPRGQTPATLASIVNGLLRGIATSPSEVLIVDPYFFAKSKIMAPSDYAALVDAVWTGVVDTATSVVVITDSSKDDPLVKSAVEAALKQRNATGALDHKASNAVHDRMWIADRTKGVFVGTSLNYLGNKYALADVIADADVASIVTELKGLSLLT